MSLVTKDQLIQKLNPIYLPHEIEERILPLAEEINRIKKKKCSHPWS